MMSASDGLFESNNDINSTCSQFFLSTMKCKYCEKTFLDDSELVLNYFHHVQNNHYDSLDDDDKLMHDIRKKMLQSKKNYELKKKNIGDSDLIFNAKNSEI